VRKQSPSTIRRRVIVASTAAAVGTVALGAAPAVACHNLDFEDGQATLATSETRHGDLVDITGVQTRRFLFYGGPENPICDYQAQLQTNLPNGYVYNDQSSFHNGCNYLGFANIDWYQWNDSVLPYASTMNAFWKDTKTQGFEKFCFERINGTDGS
jgi:hypothetical protein